MQTQGHFRKAAIGFFIVLVVWHPATYRVNVQDQVVGTMRLTAYRAHVFIAADQYQFGELAKILNMLIDGLLQRVAQADRRVVDQSARGASVLSKLQGHVEAHALNNGTDILVGVTAAFNDRARNAFRKLGWKDTELTGEHRGYKCHIIYKILGGVTGA